MKKGKRKEMKNKKKEEKKRKINKGKKYDKIWYLRGRGKIYFPPISIVTTWGKNYHFGKGG